ncbi:glycine--tRNA ligase subunit beta [Sphingomonas sp. S1-29]|uniref:glycine--tRNA ligase subunit beta n=1 Tax=Sphingomonas sp. S1-29 TaxID=2991074 RepID=UPI00223F3AC9|nr:glycine--tRNA ligase subunit beta [Sphingomonas sp. S1-29]UZK70898.1 glycine--tRNA ligase subunit beta [Sphingomonas sp. S1-29]
MADFLLELRSEEIPARMQDKARADLERLFAAELAKAGLAPGSIETYATPRRLALIARDLPMQTQAVSEELKGPRAGAPPQALEGFLRKTGLTADQLEDRGGVLFAVIEKPGRATAEVLAAAIPAIVRGFPWPKSMRWGDASASTESLRWVRPLQGIVAILGQDLVECEVAGIRSGYTTVGHRFHSPHEITLGGAGDYVEKLRMAHVLVDQDERRAIIRDKAAKLAADAGLALIEDEGLVAENAGLTEWPVPLLGRFDEAFLDVPAEVIQLTARVNQKYFVCAGAEGRLANAFVCVANIAARDGGARIVEGNQKVLAARLSDARFFYETDLKVALEEQATKLEKIVFHEKLGTVADKVDRVAKLARWLVEEGIVKSDPALAPPLPGREGPGVGRPEAVDSVPPHQPTPNPSLPGRGEVEQLAALAERAARLCKADLVTSMVGEFPELQGVMGGYYARAQGEDPRVADAIRDHYKPVGQGDDVPTAPVTVAVSLADKLDTLVSFFASDEKPTGSKDPFALRRAAISVILTLAASKLRLPLQSAVREAIETLAEQRSGAIDAATLDVAIEGMTKLLGEKAAAKMRERLKGVESPTSFDVWFSYYASEDSLLDFFADRLKVQQREAGVRHDLIDAVFALGNEDDLVRLLARVHALQAFVATPEGTNLLAGYKRAANILKKEGVAAPLPSREGPGVGGETHDRAAKDRPTPDPSLSGRGESLNAPEPFGTESTDRHPDELAARAIDHLAGDDSIPQTGEEDPLVEVDQANFTPSVGDFARSEREHAPGYAPEPAEAALTQALDAAEPRAAAAIAAEDFAEAMTALASLRAPIDAFFETVTVNDPDPAKRAARLALLARMRDAVHAVADFSKIDG